MASGNITRFERTYDDFNLANNQERRYIPVPKARALRIVATLQSGTWTNSTITIKIAAAHSASDFASAKTLATGSRNVLITEDEMKGVSELLLERTGTVDSGTLVSIHVLEQDETLG